MKQKLAQILLYELWILGYTPRHHRVTGCVRHQAHWRQASRRMWSRQVRAACPLRFQEEFPPPLLSVPNLSLWTFARTLYADCASVEEL